jgi:heme/copper-type cytochrome/quinol oxidase subunit 2
LLSASKASAAGSESVQFLTRQVAELQVTLVIIIIIIIIVIVITITIAITITTRSGTGVTSAAWSN